MLREGEYRLICGVSHKAVRCCECGELALTQTTRGGIHTGYVCNTCKGIDLTRNLNDRDVAFHWRDSKNMLDSEI